MRLLTAGRLISPNCNDAERRVKNGYFDDCPAGTSPSSEVTSVPDCLKAPFDGTLHNVTCCQPDYWHRLLLRLVDFRWLAIVDSRGVEAFEMGLQALEKLGIVAASVGFA